MKQAALTRLACRIVVLLCPITACGHAAITSHAPCAGGPVPGLFEVVDRKCENPLGGTDYCPLTQYLEIASARTFDIADTSQVLAFWYAETRDSAEYANEVRTLPGDCTSAGRYMLHNDADGVEWLLLQDGAPVEYWFEGYTQRAPRQLVYRTHLFLKPTLRTPEIDNRLRIERD